MLAVSNALTDSDLFKIFGWRTYLGISQGWLICSQQADAQKQELLDVEIRPVTDVAGLHLTPTSPSKWSTAIPCVTTVSEAEREVLLETAWYQRIASRLAYLAFTHACKSNPDDNLLQNARTYDYAVEASFFATTPQQRIDRLYAAFKATPRLTGGFVERMSDAVPTVEAYRKLENDNHLLWLQYVMLLEHRARILIIRNALDVVPPAPLRVPSRGIPWDRLRYNALPEAFRNGVDCLRGLEFGARVPYVLQVYLEYFGGFHTGEEDLAFLGRLAGVTGSDVATCLDVLNIFFPTESGRSWLATSFEGELTRLNMCPAFLRGTGCLLRRLARGLDGYDSFGRREFLMVQWHNALLAVLEKELKVPEGTESG